VSGNNGISYFYNDHLGSNTALRRPNGSRVSTYYHPFGSYRGTAPNQTITDRDFTGQPQNRAVGLLYYQARFYAPYITHPARRVGEGRCYGVGLIQVCGSAYGPRFSGGSWAAT
jgi:hypothetical protein